MAITDELNHRAYASDGARAAYANPARWRLFPAEEVVLNKLRPEIENREILDIGIGGGRTTDALLSISHRYCGIDYSETLVEAARQRFNLNTLYTCDVRDMRRFANDRFDFAMFSFNGIDNLSHDGRIRGLREIHRVLKSRAILLFSTHNRDWRHLRKFPWQMPGWWRSPAIRLSIKTLARLPRHIRMRRLETSEKDYEIVNDGGFGYRILNYYISIDSQIEQLESLGFTGVEAYGMNGEVVTADTEAPFIHYVARKGATKSG
ncbi:MAG TPA: class I SAM-dependent methyltransferase [Candidatus Binataceae bacterium]|nr:class I SAM-dependent methyltransferase [Candidatus Binataceae bacterium]